MSALPLATDYARIFLDEVPLIDLRAPVEFKEGAFPTAVSLPLMTDEERARVGTCYKQEGQAAAITLGHQLVGGAVRAARMEGWLARLRQQPDALLYCFRGGLRSQTVQQWLAEAGITRPRVAGGYKALRHFLIDTQAKASAECDWTVLTGMTGSGKTHMLAHITQAVDLEGHARHRGSSFGQLPGGQPGNIDFENRLAIELLQRRNRGESQFVLEDAVSSVAAPCHSTFMRPCAGLLWWWWRCRRRHGPSRSAPITCRISGCAIWSSMGQMQAGRCLPATSPTPWPGSSADSGTRIIANSMGCCRPPSGNRPRAGTPAPIWSGSGCC